MDCSLPCPSPGDLPDPGIRPESPALQVEPSPSSHQGSSPKDISKSKPLVFVNVTLCGNSFLAHIIKDLEIILVSEWASIPVMGVLKRDRTGDDTMMRVISRQGQRLEWPIYKPRITKDSWHCQKLGERQGRHSPTQPPKETNPADLDSGLLASRIVREYISVVLSHSVCDHFLQ